MNVLVLMCDHLRYDAIACHGNPYIRTPNLDRLAARSVRFTNAYCSSPLCGPTRHSLATGLYPYRHGVIANSALPVPGMRTIAHHLRQHGYRAGAFGHMHWQRLEVPPGTPGTPGTVTVPLHGGGQAVYPEHGYEMHEAWEHDLSMLTEHQKHHRLWEELSETSNRTGGVAAIPDEHSHAAQTADAAIKQLRAWKASGQRFLSWTSFQDPHPPFFASRELYGRYAAMDLPAPRMRPEGSSPTQEEVGKNPIWAQMTPLDHKVMKAGFYALVERADRQIGRVLDTLDELDLWKDTMILFTVDHGEMLGDHGLYFKSVMWESAVHMPFYVYHPQIAPGERRALAEHVDVLPTICECLGIPVPEGVQGRSLKPLLDSPQPPTAWREYALAQLNEKLMVRTDRWKLFYEKGEPVYLFDLENDPEELHNQLTQRPEIAQALAGLLDRDHPGLIATTRQLMAARRVRKKKLKPGITLVERV